MTGGSNRRQVNVVRIGEDCAVAQQTPEAARFEQVFKACQVVVAKLIDDDSKDQADLWRPGLFPSRALRVSYRSRATGGAKNDNAKRECEPMSQTSADLNFFLV